MSTILVTGATGTVGSQVAEALLERGDHRVRVGVRSPRKAEALRAAGAEVVALDFERPESLAAAFEGVERAFLLIPFVNDFDRLVPAVLAAAERAGVKHIVKLSSIGADADSALALARKHAAADGALAESNIDHTILKPTFFQDNLLKYQLGALRGQGAFYGASHGGKVSYVSSRDIAQVAAKVLGDPSGHEAKDYVLTGPEAIEDARVAELASAALGKTIAYVDVPDEAYAASMRQNGSPEWMVESMLGLEQVKSAGYAEAVSDAVQRVLGRAPEAMPAFLARHADALAE
ncbi:MAG TPA: NAD(P)-dependent oxidoreductase [Myxococcales bacterium]|nr:NAD(P)-dependent oxidoreductase [Myxococcales bacterium]